jgi:paraquat-inducible protein B
VNYFNYFSEIEDSFIRRRGKGLLLSPFDWALMEVWQERGIPLHIVLRGIEIVFDNHDRSNKKKRSVKGLAFCREEIEVQFSEWQESQIGKPAEAEVAVVDDEFSRDKIDSHISKVICQLLKFNHPELAETISRAIDRLNALLQNPSDNFEQTEASLSDIENFISAGLKQNAKLEHLKETSAEVQKQLSIYKSKMETSVYQTTFDIMLLKKLRNVYEIPRLSLFYL